MIMAEDLAQEAEQTLSLVHYALICSESEDDESTQPPPSDQQLDCFVAPPAVISEPSLDPTVDRPLHLLLLPQELLHNILHFLPYSELSRIRITCQGIKQASECVLNQGFQKIQSRIQRRFHNIKSQMPRRESARRKHPLARECDIMETLHMRMALLQMTFGRRIERGHCCFFAGEVLDEVLRILDYVTTTTNIGRAYKVTDELFDLSTMAMEYFKEKIEPALPEINLLSPDFTPIFSTPNSRSVLMKALETTTADGEQKSTAIPSTSSAIPDAALASPPAGARIKKMGIELRKLKSTVNRCMHRMSVQRGQLRDATSKLEQQDRKIEEQNRRIEALMTELHQCQGELRQLQAVRKEAAGCLMTAKPDSPAMSVGHSSRKEPAASLLKPPSLTDQLSPGKRIRTSSSSDEADCPSPKKTKC